MKEIKTGLSASYYTVPVMHSAYNDGEYLLECVDVLEALQLTYSEANVIKAIWRTASKRVLNVSKGGTTDLYDMEKVYFFCKKICRSSSHTSGGSENKFPGGLKSDLTIRYPENVAQPFYTTGLSDIRDALKLTKSETNLVTTIWVAAGKRLYVGSPLSPYAVYGSSDLIILDSFSQQLLDEAKNG